MDREFTHLEAAWLSAEALADEARRDAERAAAEAETASQRGGKVGDITVVLTSAQARHEEAERKARAAFDKLWSARQGGNSAAA